MFDSYFVRQETETPIQKENNVKEVQVNLETDATTQIIFGSTSPAPG